MIAESIAEFYWDFGKLKRIWLVATTNWDNREEDNKKNSLILKEKKTHQSQADRSPECKKELLKIIYFCISEHNSS